MANLHQHIITPLWVKFPRHSKQVEVSVQLYAEYAFCVVNDHQQANTLQAHLTYNSETLDSVLDMLKQLQQKDLINGMLWTQCVIHLQQNGQARFEFAHVPLENSHPALFLKGLGELSQEASLAYDVDEEEYAVLHEKFPHCVKIHTLNLTYQPKDLFDVAVDVVLGRNGVEQNNEKAYDYFDRLIRFEATSLAAYYNWAAMWSDQPQYLETSTVNVAYVVAQAKKGELAALFVLGLMCQSGYQDIAANIVRAKKCFFKATELGFIPAQMRLDDLCVDSADLTLE